MNGGVKLTTPAQARYGIAWYQLGGFMWGGGGHMATCCFPHQGGRRG